MKKNILEMKNIVKSFPGVMALKNGYLELKSGEVHALLGENGAGKSTLMKILGGIYLLDSGEITLDGEDVLIEDVNKSKSLGISIIHQELVLVPEMSVAENIFLGQEPCNKFGFVNKELMEKKAQEILDSFSLKIEASTSLKNLNIAQQQMVEIVKAISHESKILIMDEPTSSLTDKEVEFLFATIETLKNKGVGIVYISHRMEELFRITDRITVMRDGEYIGTRRTKETTREDLINMMVGRELNNYYSRSFHKAGETVLEIKNLYWNENLKNINFHLKKGEVLGFSGLVGAGRSELMKIIFGLEQPDQGDILIKGKKVFLENPLKAMENGIALVPENRKEEGLILGGTVGYNMTLRVLDDFISGIKNDLKKENKIISEYIENLNIKTPSASQLVGNLSGGNQQKVVFAKWLATKPDILILDEPTRGVDVGAKAEIYSIIDKLASEGVSIILVSSELPEVIGMSDRIIVMNEGKITGILDKENFAQEKIMHYATGGF